MQQTYSGFSVSIAQKKKIIKTSNYVDNQEAYNTGRHYIHWKLGYKKFQTLRRLAGLYGLKEASLHLMKAKCYFDGVNS
jgi:hypothetical protein